MKLRGGILYYSLFVIILSTAIISLLLLSSFYDSRLLINSIKIDELKANVHSAINLYLGGEKIFQSQDSLTLDLFDSPEKRVNVWRRRWGNYYIIKASANWKNLSYYKEALIGNDLNEQEPVALFINDEGRVLSLSGNTVLKGTCYLPSKTIRAASIEGQPYIYKNLVLGELKKSPVKLPEINPDLFRFADDFLINGPGHANLVNITSLDSNIVTNSFHSKTLVIYNNSFTSLSGFHFSGNIIIWSTLPLILDETTRIGDILIFAPEITFRSGFSGELQAFAIQSINVEDNCKLSFPSQLCVIQSEIEKYNPSDSLKISVGDKTIVEGGLIVKTAGLTSFVKIQSTAKVVGQIYCPGIVELQGEIIGSLYCNSFYLGTPRARYYNHLLNTRIDFMSLSEYFSGVDLIDEIPEKSIIKWLD